MANLFLALGIAFFFLGRGGTGVSCVMVHCAGEDWGGFWCVVVHGAGVVGGGFDFFFHGFLADAGAGVILAAGLWTSL